MKKIVYALVFLFFIAACQNNNKDSKKIIVKGKIETAKTGIAILKREKAIPSRETDSLTSSPIVNGEFFFETTLDFTSVCHIALILDKEIKMGDSTVVQKVMRNKRIALENQTDTVYFTVNNIGETNIEGSFVSDKILYLAKGDEELTAERQALMAKKGQREEYSKALKEYRVSQKKKIKNILQSDEDTLVKVMLLQVYGISEDYEIEFADSCIKEFAKNYGADYYHLKRLSFLVEKAKALNKTKIGQKFADIKTLNLKDEEMTFSSVMGNNKYVLLEFWASWCGPCRKEIPMMKKAYAKFHSKGFEIYGISTDKKKEAWLKASNDENLPWINTHIIDEPGKNAKITYVVNRLPTNFLFGPEGTIIAKDLRSEALEEKLSELLK